MIRRLAASCPPSAASQPALIPLPARSAPRTYSPSCKVRLLASNASCFDPSPSSKDSLGMALGRSIHNLAEPPCGAACRRRTLPMPDFQYASWPYVWKWTGQKASGNDQVTLPLHGTIPNLVAHAVAKSERAYIAHMNAHAYLNFQAHWGYCLETGPSCS